MKTMLALTALTLVGGVLAGCAANPSGETATQVASRGPDACFRNTDIVNTNIADENTLYVATRRGYVYRLDAPGCYQAGAPVSVGALGAGGFGGSVVQQVCVGNQAPVSTNGAVCSARISGPHTDSRQTGLWSRTAAP